MYDRSKYIFWIQIGVNWQKSAINFKGIAWLSLNISEKLRLTSIILGKNEAEIEFKFWEDWRDFL